MLRIPLRSRTRKLRRFARGFFVACRRHGVDPDSRQALDLFALCAAHLLDSF